MTKARNPLRTLQESSVRAMLTQIRMLEDAQRAWKSTKGDDGKPARDLPELKRLADQASAVGRGAAALLAEARKQNKADEDAIGSMTMEGKVGYVLAFLEELPIEQRARIRARLDELGGGLL